MTPFAHHAQPPEAEPLDSNPRAVRGGNRPPIASFYAEQNETLPAYLAEDNVDITARVTELTEAFARAPETVTTDDVAGKVSDFIAQIAKCAKSAEAKRVDLKAGPLTAGRLIDGYFQKQILEKLDNLKKPLVSRLTVFERAKAEEERKRREAAEAEARRVAQEAERARLAAEAAIRDAATLEAAVAAEEAAAQAKADADKAAQEAAVKASALHTTRGEFGSSSSLRTVWVARIEDAATLDLNAIRDFIATDAVQRALNSYVKIHKNNKPLKGVSFAEETSSVVRG